MKYFITAYAATLLSPLAQANDVVVSLSAGGIVFRKTDAIAMKKEVLNVSRSLISVDYEFMNESAAEVEETIVFPLPTYPAAPDPSPVYYGQPAGFSISVDDKPVSFSTRLTALREEMPGKMEDVTAQLKKAGLTDAQIAFNPAFRTAPKVAPLTPRQRQQLVSLGLIGEVPGETSAPVWQVQVNYVWKQKFPPGQVVRVHHAYRPFVNSGPGAWIKPERIVKDYCGDQNLVAAWKKISARSESHDVTAQQVSYILKTGNSWKNGIEDFTLNVIKRNPAELVSLCFPGTFKKIDATTYQVRLSNFRPKEDLEVYFGNIDGEGTDNTGVMPTLAR